MWHLLSLFFLQYHSVDNVYATTHECLSYNYKIFFSSVTLQILNFFWNIFVDLQNSRFFILSQGRLSCVISASEQTI